MKLCNMIVVGDLRSMPRWSPMFGSINFAGLVHSCTFSWRTVQYQTQDILGDHRRFIVEFWEEHTTCLLCSFPKIFMQHIFVRYSIFIDASEFKWCSFDSMEKSNDFFFETPGTYSLPGLNTQFKKWDFVL